MVYLEVCKFKKKTSGWKIFLLRIPEYHRLEYRDRYVVCKFEGRGIFLSEISSRGAKVPLKMNENIINFKALPIFLPKGDSWGFSICHSWYLAEQNDTKKALILIFSGFDQQSEFSYQPKITSELEEVKGLPQPINV